MLKSGIAFKPKKKIGQSFSSFNPCTRPSLPSVVNRRQEIVFSIPKSDSDEY